MIGCFLDPQSCIPEWAKLIWTYWDSLLVVFLAGVVVGGLGGWKALAVAMGGLLAIFALRRKAEPEPAWETGEDDPLAGFPPEPKPKAKPKVLHRTAKRTPPDPPPSLTSGN